MIESLQQYLKADHYYAGVGLYLAKNPMISKKDMEIPSPLLILASLSETPFNVLCEYIASLPSKTISKTSIPQFNSITGGSIGLLSLLAKNNDYGMSFIDIGANTEEPVKDTDVAHEKYGQLHASLAYEMDLVYLVPFDGKRHVYISDFGYALMKFNPSEQRNLCAKLMATIPIISYMLHLAKAGDVCIDTVLEQFISGQTVYRRSLTVEKLLNEMRTCAVEPVDLLERIK